MPARAALSALSSAALTDGAANREASADPNACGTWIPESETTLACSLCLLARAGLADEVRHEEYETRTS